MVFARMLEHLVSSGTGMKLPYIVNTRIFFVIIVKGSSAYPRVLLCPPETKLKIWFVVSDIKILHTV